mmetsp:Transcript_4235/g.11835  ORF Transcript_4235/g.11835 Transcript_4235/m.11835 type:complete len:216 (-) Transcript_4235:90-737(-)
MAPALPHCTARHQSSWRTTGPAAPGGAAVSTASGRGGAAVTAIRIHSVQASLDRPFRYPRSSISAIRPAISSFRPRSSISSPQRPCLSRRNKSTPCRNSRSVTALCFRSSARTTGTFSPTSPSAPHSARCSSSLTISSSPTTTAVVRGVPKSSFFTSTGTPSSSSLRASSKDRRPIAACNGQFPYPSRSLTHSAAIVDRDRQRLTDKQTADCLGP